MVVVEAARGLPWTCKSLSCSENRRFTPFGVCVLTRSIRNALDNPLIYSCIYLTLKCRHHGLATHKRAVLAFRPGSDRSVCCVVTGLCCRSTRIEKLILSRRGEYPVVEIALLYSTRNPHSCRPVDPPNAPSCSSRLHQSSIGWVCRTRRHAAPLSCAGCL